MLTRKNCQLKGIKYVINEDGSIKSAMIVKFKKSKYFIFLPQINKGNFIKNFVDTFNLGITNVNTYFNFID